VQAIFERKVDCLNVISAANCVFREVRHKAEDKFDYLNIKYKAELSYSKLELRSKES